MWEALRQWVDAHGLLLWWVAAGSGVLLIGSAVALLVLAVAAPRDFLKNYLAEDDPGPASTAPDWRTRHPVLRWSLRVLKNVLGVVLAVAGLAMLVLPGQGLVTLAVALVLLDLPGKRRLERRVLQSPRVLGPINRLRRRFGKEELRVD